MASQNGTKYKITMFPWFATGHVIPYLHLSNELANRGHKISFILPKKAQLESQHLNLYPDSIIFHVITVPQVEGLPPGTETHSEIDRSLSGVLATAFDLTKDQVKGILHQLKPDFVFYDFAHWVPELAKEVGSKTVSYNVVSAACIAVSLVATREFRKDKLSTIEADLMASKIWIKKHEAASRSLMSEEYGKGITFYDRVTTALKHNNAIAIRTCRELEGPFCYYIQSHYGNPVLLTGPVLPEPSRAPMEDRWAKWLAKFEPGEVIFCAFGSQIFMDMKQFQELVLGIERTGLPFLLAIKPPEGVTTIEDALPQGFQDRVGGRGIVCGTWVPQTEILNHLSIGCFVSHCGFGSMWEGLMSHCQIVLLPHFIDHIMNAGLLAEELQVAVEVEKDENGVFSKENVSKAIKIVMDKDSEVGNLIRGNHEKWKKTTLKPNFVSNYIDDFIQQLDEL